MKRKKPVGAEWVEFITEWNKGDHNKKVELAEDYGATYDTAKHWASEGATDPKVVLPSVVALEVPSANTPLILNIGEGMTTFAVVGDTHNPYQDNRTLAVVEAFLEEIQPDYLVYNGDINDFYQVSVFDKSPERLGSLQQDLNITTGMFERHNITMPNTKKILIEGTHEYRYFKYLRIHAPALANLDSTKVSELYKLDDYDITYLPFEQGMLINRVFLILHGNLVSQHSSYTAKRHFERNGGSGICNHTHRGGSYYKRDRFNTYGWWENFCLCNLNPDWIKNPDWTQGFSLVHFSGDRYWVEQIPIIDHKFIYGGKVYGRG